MNLTATKIIILPEKSENENRNPQKLFPSGRSLLVSEKLTRPPTPPKHDACLTIFFDEAQHMHILLIYEWGRHMRAPTLLLSVPVFIVILFQFTSFYQLLLRLLYMPTFKLTFYICFFAEFMNHGVFVNNCSVLVENWFVH